LFNEPIQAQEARVVDIKDVDVMAVAIQDEGVSDAGIKDEGIIEGFIYEGQPDGAVWKGMLAGLAGGLAASWTMNRFQAGLSKLPVHQNGGASDSRQVQGDDATVKAASAVSETLTHHKLAPDEKRMAGPVGHYVFGSTIGALYGAAAEIAPATAKAWGLPFGAAVWVGADEIGVPAARLSEPPNRIPASTHASALAAHLVYGATTDGVRRLVRAMLK
jgi:putative membrane protein